ncbi:MAG: S8 family serine peptidase, partial [Oscillospiraceae bacterium]|nr:S8 family serine peptidase [Oscillospiraceae bacterium]
MKKIISAFLSIALLFTSAVSAAPAIDKGEKVTLIVEVEGESLLETKNAVVLGASEFMKTDEAKTTEAHILSVQSKVKSDIEKRVRADADKGFTYTSVFNGFSMEAYTSDIEKIKATDGVKNVYISQTYKIPEDKISDEPAMLFDDTDDTYDDRVSADMMNVRYMYDLGYDGRGQAVAIIDSEFDTAHEFFASEVKDPKFSKSDIKAFLENNELNINASVNQVYKSSKIPFAYDYGEGDADTYSTENIHGTHVAGIVGGKNGNYYGNVFSGTAPEAQLILMKAGYNIGELSDDATFAALDDVSKTDVCAVNCSFGEDIIINELYQKIGENLRNTGIAVIAAAGNSDRAYETTDNPDYVYPSAPAVESKATSVASVDSDTLWVLDNTITLGNGEVLEYDAHDSGNFFEGFSDKFYEYVILNDISDIKKNDMNGKIGVYPDAIAGSDIETALHDAGALGRIIIMPGKSDSASGFRLDLRAAAVKKSSGEKLIACEEKILKTTPGTKHYKKRADSGMSSFTSWGTNTMLELKPEISAPGGNILSSGPDDKYENKSGTSMATPHITGAAALMNGFIEYNYPYVTGADRVALTENLLMSSANIMFQDKEKTLPESPRRQGAGLADLEAAAKIPVILKGDSGKSKLSLYDMLGDEITLKFTAENLT